MKSVKFILLSLVSWAWLSLPISYADPFSNFPGAIPLKYVRTNASDLVYKGKTLLPDEAHELYMAKKFPYGVLIPRNRKSGKTKHLVPSINP